MSKKGIATPKAKIVEYWKKSPLKDLLNWTGGEQCCMACGGKGRDRAHIKSESHGGSSQPHNLHLLCSSCHKESEEKTGFRYWAWLRMKSLLYDNGSDMCYEIDEGNKYPMQWEYRQKLKDYAAEYYYHSLLIPFHDNEQYSCWTPDHSMVWGMILLCPHLFNLSYTPVNMDDLIEVMRLEEISEIHELHVSTLLSFRSALEVESQ